MTVLSPQPEDIFDVVCHLDVVMDWLKAHGYHDEAERILAVSHDLTDNIVLSLPDPQE